MKKIWLIALVFNGCFLFENLKMYSSEKNLFSKYSGISFLISANLSKADEVSLSPLLYGIKGSLPFAEGVFYQKGEDFNYGLAFFTKYYIPKLKLTLKLGELNSSGALSKLNSPALSSNINAFSSAINSVNAIKASLPSSSSFNKSPSLFLEYEYTNNEKVIQKFKTNIFCLPLVENEEEKITFCKDFNQLLFSASFLLKLKLLKNKSLSSSYAAGIFPLKENTKSSWFFTEEKEKYFHQQNIFCQNLQLAYTSPVFSSCNIFSFYQSPFGAMDFSARTENRIKLKKIAINLAAFFTPDELITASQKALSSQLQLKLGFHYNFIRGFDFKENPIPLFINCGINSYICKENKSLLLKNALGIRCSSDYFILSLSGIINLSYDNQEAARKPLKVKDWSIQTKETLLLKDFKPDLSQELSITANTNKTSDISQKYKLSWIFPKNPSFSGSTSFSFIRNNKETKKRNFSISAAAQFSIKKIKCSAKFSFILETS